MAVSGFNKFTNFFKKYKGYSFLVFTLLAANRIISKLLDPGEPKNPKNLSKIEGVNLVRFNTGKSKKSPYVGIEGIEEVNNQVNNSLLLSSKLLPSRKFAEFAEKNLLPKSSDISFARAFPLAKLVRSSLHLPNELDKLRILSIGCRDGIEMACLKRVFGHISNVEIVGLDLVQSVPEIQVGDMHDMPFDDEYFDIVISSHSLEHSYNPQKAINEIQRVAKDTALIGIEVPITNAYGSSPEWIKTGSDNWNFCNPSVLLSLFDNSYQLRNQQVTLGLIRVVLTQIEKATVLS